MAERRVKEYHEYVVEVHVGLSNGRTIVRASKPYSGHPKSESTRQFSDEQRRSVAESAREMGLSIESHQTFIVDKTIEYLERVYEKRSMFDTREPYLRWN